MYYKSSRARTFILNGRTSILLIPLIAAGGPNGYKTVPQKRLSPTPPASAVARGGRHNSTRPVSRNPRATSTPRSTSTPLNAVSGCRGGRAGESTAGVVDCEEATNPRERVARRAPALCLIIKERRRDTRWTRIHSRQRV